MWPTTTLLILLISLNACSTAAPPADSRSQRAASQVQSIIKFKNPETGVDSGLLARLGQASGARIDYVRAMSGGAHVVVISPQGAQSYERVLSDLRADPAIDYVEPDVMMRIQR